MLLGNGTYLNLNAGRLLGGTATPISQGNYQKVGAWRGVALQDKETEAKPLIGYPTGYSGAGWFMPIKGGELTSLYNTDFSFTPTGSMLEGRALETSIGDPTTFVFTATGTGGLIATVGAGEATSSFGFTTNAPDLTASLSGEGTTTFGIATGTSTLTADGLAVATATFGFTADWAGYATGSMEGTTADSGVTVDNIVAALESAVLPVNIVKVNDYEVTGNGQSGTEWGPV